MLSGCWLGPSSLSFAALPTPSYRALSSQAQATDAPLLPCPRRGQPVGAGAIPGRLALTSPHLSLRGLEGRRHPRGGLGGAQQLVPWSAQAGAGPGLPAHPHPSSCPPLLGAVPPTGGAPCMGSRQALQSRRVIMEGAALKQKAPYSGGVGCWDPSALLFASFLPGRTPRPGAPRWPQGPPALCSAPRFSGRDLPPQEGSWPWPCVGVAVMKNQSS